MKRFIFLNFFCVFCVIFVLSALRIFVFKYSNLAELFPPQIHNPFSLTQTPLHATLRAQLNYRR